MTGTALTFDLMQLINMGIYVLATFGGMAGFYYALRGDVRSLQESNRILSDEVAALKKEIRSDQFIRKGDVDRLLNDANETHARQDKEIDNLRARMDELVDKLAAIAVSLSSPQRRTR